MSPGVPELMLALEPYGSGLHREHVLVQFPELDKETVKETPVYELYKACTGFEKNLATLVREAAVGVARPEEVDAFLEAPDTTLESADAWFASLLELGAPRVVARPLEPADECLRRFRREQVAPVGSFHRLACR
jgi:hypothetical protein